MHGDGKFASSGLLRISVEVKPVTTQMVERGQPMYVNLMLAPGYNLVELEFLGGDFAPEGGGDFAIQ